jgi:hypothetical protein
MQKIEFQKEYLGYMDITTGKEEDKRKLLVLEIKPLVSKNSGKTWAYSIDTMSMGSGKKSRLTVMARMYDKLPLVENDVVYANKIEKNTKGYWHLLNYKVVNEDFS